VIVDYIESHRDRFGVEPICTVLSEHGCSIAPSTYYERRAQPVTDAELEDAYLANALVTLHREEWSVYGARKLYKAARYAGLDVGRDQVARLMRIAGIHGVVRGRHHTTTTRRDASAPRHPDLVGRGWDAPKAVDELWVADFSYVWTLTGFVYVAFVVDVYSRRILGWRVSGSMRTQLVLDAFRQALHTRHRGAANSGAHWTSEGLIHHSDAGSQGGINWSSQHLVNEEVFDGASTGGCGSCETAGYEFTGASLSAASGGTGVLAADRCGDGQRGRRGRCWRVRTGRVAVVPPRWRHATHQSCSALGPVPVVG
jgi:Integrase core domain/HTH-like domain